MFSGGPSSQEPEEPQEPEESEEEDSEDEQVRSFTMDEAEFSFLDYIKR